MDWQSPGAMRKSYRNQTIPKDEARVRQILPGIRDATRKLHEICVSAAISEDGTNIRAASETDEEYFTALTDLFRCYRWLTGVAKIDNFELKEKYAVATIEALREGISVMEKIIPFTDPSSAHCWIRVSIRDAMSCGMQSLANCVRNAPSVQDVVWTHFFEIIRFLIILEEDKLLNCVSAVIMNCLTDARLEEIVECEFGRRIFERISFFKKRHDSLVTFEAIFDLSAHLLQCPLVAQRDYDLLPLNARCTILDLLSSSFVMHSRSIMHHHNSLHSLEDSLIPSFWPQKIAEEFKNNCMSLTRLKDHSSIIDEECELLMKVLNLLGNMTASDDLRPLFVTDTKLFDGVIELFLAVDKIGNSGENLFTPVTKMANVKPQDLVTPSRGIKSHLLRLFANLVYQNAPFETRVHTTNLTVRLKDCTRIDYRNPYVQQWAVLAMRNVHFSGLIEEMQLEEAELMASSPVERMKASWQSETVEALDLQTGFTQSVSVGPHADGGGASSDLEEKSS